MFFRSDRPQSNPRDRLPSCSIRRFFSSSTVWAFTKASRSEAGVFASGSIRLRARSGNARHAASPSRNLASRRALTTLSSADRSFLRRSQMMFRVVPVTVPHSVTSCA